MYDEMLNIVVSRKQNFPASEKTRGPIFSALLLGDYMCNSHRSCEFCDSVQTRSKVWDI